MLFARERVIKCVSTVTFPGRVSARGCSKGRSRCGRAEEPMSLGGQSRLAGRALPLCAGRSGTVTAPRGAGPCHSRPLGSPLLPRAVPSLSAPGWALPLFPTPRGAAQDCNTLRGGLRSQHRRSSRNQTISRMEVESVVFCHFWLNSSSFVLWCFQAKVKRSHAYKREGIISGRKIVWLHISYF